jgi:hypothetical protein
MTAYTYVATSRDTTLESAHAALVATHRMAGLRAIFDHSRILADDSSFCRAMASAASFIPAITIFGAVAGVGGNVGRGRAGHAALARRTAVSNRLGAGSSGSAVRLRAVHLFAFREKFQRAATRRAAGGSWCESRPAAGDGWNPFASAASSVSGAPVRDAGLERGHRARSLLGIDRVRRGRGSGDDPNGGCGVGEAVWRLLPRVSQLCARSAPAGVREPPVIIRCD